MVNLNEIRFAIKTAKGLITSYGNGVPLRSWEDANAKARRQLSKYEGFGADRKYVEAEYGKDYTIVPVKMQILEIG